MPSMTTTTIATLALTAAALSAVPTSVDAYPRFIEKIPNGGAVKSIVALGHVDTKQGGGERNAFGRAFENAKLRWTTELCQADSDGDGQTNGQELGDPCCSWVETGNLAYISGVSDPSDPASRVNPVIFKGLQCTRSEEAVEEADRLAKLAKKTKKPKATTKAPKASMDMDEWEDDDDESGSSSAATTLRKNVQSDSVPGQASAAATSHRRTEASATATATALTVALAVAWALV